MDVVIIGNGKVGSTLASLLEKEGHAVTIIDNKADAFSKTQYALDIMCIQKCKEIPKQSDPPQVGKRRYFGGQDDGY